MYIYIYSYMLTHLIQRHKHRHRHTDAHTLCNRKSNLPSPAPLPLSPGPCRCLSECLFLYIDFCERVCVPECLLLHLCLSLSGYCICGWRRRRWRRLGQDTAGIYVSCPLCPTPPPSRPTFVILIVRQMRRKGKWFSEARMLGLCHHNAVNQVHPLQPSPVHLLQLFHQPTSHRLWDVVVVEEAGIPLFTIMPPSSPLQPLSFP
jgi:hypothetical protein